MNKNSWHVIKAQQRKKEFAIRAFGGKCQMCGYSRCHAALEFHHPDEDKKEYSPSYIIGRWSWERAKPELEKCVLLCSNCHREVHYIGEDNTNLYVLRRKPFMVVVCEQCGTEFDTKNYEQKYCSKSCQHLASRKIRRQPLHPKTSELKLDTKISEPKPLTFGDSIRPGKSELEKLLKENISFVRLGKMFGVSDNAVRKWAKRYGIELPKRKQQQIYRFECAVCHKPVESFKASAKYCSHKCMHIGQGQHEPLSKEILEDGLKFHSMHKLGEILNVPYWAIRKWCFDYGLTSRFCKQKNRIQDTSTVCGASNLQEKI
jgi:endogenous inhibitor of DNA gyrase (YacG/DUF329 family)